MATERRAQACYHAADLFAMATALLTRAGLPDGRARIVAEVLLEGDLLGHTTHGLDLLAGYLRELDADRMTKDGDPYVIADRGPALTWDGRYLPGPWLVKQAIAVARGRLSLLTPVVTVAIRRSHHLACLQAYLKPVTDAGLVVLLTCSDPAATGVAPHGGTAPRITPNPIAAGLPTERDPILIDVSMSTTTNAMVKRVAAEGGQVPGPWLVDAEGRPSTDPSVLFGDRPGAILPLGGLDLGHKGFALALLVEALTSGLAGHGRLDAPDRWGASVFVQLIDPDGFGGRLAFRQQMSGLVARCHETPVAPGHDRVRMPGEGALARRERQMRAGVELAPTVMPALESWATRYDVTLPAAVR